MKTKTLRNIKYGIIGIVIALAVSQMAIGQPCERWDVSGKWTVHQSNRTSQVVSLKQSGSVITGSARFFNKNRDFTRLTGDVAGTIKGNQFSMEITWGAGDSVGIYTGTIAPSGRINGQTYDRFHPETKAEWTSNAKMKCL